MIRKTRTSAKASDDNVDKTGGKDKEEAAGAGEEARRGGARTGLRRLFPGRGKRAGSVEAPEEPRATDSAATGSGAPSSEAAAESAEQRKSPSRLVRVTTIALSVLLLAGVGLVAWRSTLWIHNAFWVQPKVEARQQALTDARQAAINLNTFNAKNVDKTFADIQSSTTGDLASGFKSSQNDLKKAISSTDAVHTARVVDTSLTQFDYDSGTAKALALLVVTETSKDQPKPQQYRLGMTLSLQKVGDVWKASDAKPLFSGSEGVPAPQQGAPAPQQPAPAQGGGS